MLSAALYFHLRQRLLSEGNLPWNQAIKRAFWRKNPMMQLNIHRLFQFAPAPSFQVPSNSSQVTYLQGFSFSRGLSWRLRPIPSRSSSTICGVQLQNNPTCNISPQNTHRTGAKSQSDPQYTDFYHCQLDCWGCDRLASVEIPREEMAR